MEGILNGQGEPSNMDVVTLASLGRVPTADELIREAEMHPGVALAALGAGQVQAAGRCSSSGSSSGGMSRRNAHQLHAHMAAALSDPTPSGSTDGHFGSTSIQPRLLSKLLQMRDAWQASCTSASPHEQQANGESLCVKLRVS